MSECGGNPEKCSMCGKKGLPILLTRYAVATRDTTQWYNDPRNTQKTIALMQSSGAPKISDDFVVPEIDLGTNAYYTLRLLRGGYVYMYDEARKTWKGYFLTEESNLIEFNVQETFGQAAVKGEHPGKKTPCKPLGYSFLARCVTLEKPEEATNLWFAFSDVQWTEATWKKFDANEEGIREKQMRKLDIKQWLETQKSPHACRFYDASKHVAEYCDTINPAAFDFGSTPLARLGYYDFGPKIRAYNEKIVLKEKFVLKEYYREDEFEPYLKLIKKYKETRKLVSGNSGDGLVINDLCTLANVNPNKGGIGSLELDKLLADSYMSPLKMGLAGSMNARQVSEEVRAKMPVLALDDVPGITMDLANLMSARHVIFTEQDGYKRKAFASASIAQFKSTVLEEAEYKALEKKQNDYRQQFSKIVRKGRGAVRELTPLENLTPEQRADYYAIELTPEEIEKARQDTWASYSKMYPDASEASKKDRPLYDEAAREKFEKEYAALLTEFDKDSILPLAHAHAKWMASTPLAAYFGSYYDTADIESGMVYVSVLLMCISNTQDKGPCSALYDRWIESGELQGITNLLMRATVLNQNALAQTVHEAVTEIQKLMQEGLEREEKARQKKELQDKVSGIEEKADDFPLERVHRLFYKVIDDFTKYVGNRSETPTPQYSGNLDRLKREDQINRLLTHLYHQVIGSGVKHYINWAKTRRVTPFVIARAFYTKKQSVSVNLYAPYHVHWEYARNQNTIGSKAYIRNKKGSEDLFKRIRERDPKTLQDYMYTEPADLDKITLDSYRPIDIDFDSMTEAQRNRFGALMSRKGDAGVLTLYNLETWQALNDGKWDEALELMEAGREEKIKAKFLRAERRIGKLSNRSLTAVGTYTAFAGVFSSWEVLNEIDGKGTEAQQREANARFATAVTSLVGAWADIASQVVQFERFQLKYGSAVTAKWAEQLTKWGRGLGAPGALLSVALDIMGGLDAYAKGQYGLATVRGISAILGVASFVFLCTTFALIGLIVFVGMIITSVLISLWEDHPFRDWIGKCSFGHYPDKIKYSDAEEEIKAFQGISGTRTQSAINSII